MGVPLPYLLITVKEVDLQKLLVSDMQNLKTFPTDTECRWQVFFSELRQFNATISDGIISKTRNFLRIFLSIFEIYTKF